MKKVLVFLVFTYGSLGLWAQGSKSKIIAESPTASSMGKYNDSNISLYTGQVSTNVPIYQIKFNDFVFPISINYSSSGLKIHDYPSWVGMGWTLAASGVINRQMRGIPDETTHGYVGVKPTATIVEYLIANSGASSYQIDGNYPLLAKKYPAEPDDYRKERTRKKFIAAIGENVYDGEPDIFSMSGAGLSGKFFFDKSAAGSSIKSPVLVPRQPVNVSATFTANALLYNGKGSTGNINGTIAKFVVTDANGVKYTFDKPEIMNYGDPLELGNNPNAWYLSNITTPNGNTLDFQYLNRSLQMPHNVSERKYIYKFSDLNAFSGSGDYSKFTQTAQKSTNYNINSVINEYVLQKIVINGGAWGEVNFIEDNVVRPDWCAVFAPNPCNTNPNSTASKALKEITVKDGKGVLVKRFVMDYNYGSNRLLLKSFKETGDNVSEFITHKFEYLYEDEIPPLPVAGSAFMFKEDHWGYYNNNTTSTLLPDYTGNDPNSLKINGSNRAPDARKSVIGQLSKLTYPTGGTTSFYYEPNDYYGRRSANFNVCAGNVAVVASASIAANNQRTTTSLQVSKTIPFTVPTGGLGCAQISWQASLHTTDDIIGGTISILGPTTNYSKNFQANRVAATVVGGSGTEAINLPAGSYTLVVSLSSDNISKTNTSFISASVEGVQPTGPGVDIYENRVGGGVRISRIEDCLDANSTTGCLVKEYSYQNPADLTKSSGRLASEGNYTAPGLYYFYITKSDDGQIDPYYVDDIMHPRIMPTFIGSLTFTSISSSSQVPLANTSGNHVGYSSVTVREIGKNAANTAIDNGQTVNYFYGLDDYPDAVNINFPYHVESIDWKRGQSKSLLIYGKDNSTVPAKSVDNQLDYMLSPAYSKQISIKAGMYLHNVDYTDLDFVYDKRFLWLSYYTLTGRQYVSQTTQKEYFSLTTPQPTNITNVTNYAYRNPVGLQLSESSTTNSEGKLIVTQYRYTYDIMNNIGVINPNLTATAGLLQFAGKHTIPIQTEIFKNNKRISLENTYYSAANRVLRYEKFLGTSTIPMAYTDFLRYDNMGNIVAMNEHTGPIKSFLWGYNGQYPVINVEGYEIPTGQENALLTSWLSTDIDTKAATLQATGRLVSKYVYKPLVGALAITAPNNITTSYEYDGLERLKTIKNTKGQVIKSYQYNYRPQ